MVHVLTVHWQDDKWIDLQLRFLRRHLHGAFRTYAFLNGIAPGHERKFDYCDTTAITDHATKLNMLAEVACREGAPGDVLMFIDGDAFPVADLSSYVAEKLSTYRLVAVQRQENDGDRQPHPCFAATTVACWQSLPGDWSRGYKWRTRGGNEKTDVGGNLLRILEEKGIPWYPMLRSNRKNPHPLLFAVYDRVVYHHGAGFRAAVSHLERAKHGIRNVGKKILRDPRHADHPAQAVFRQVMAENEALKAEMFRRICADENFFLDLL